ncbi:zinc finger, CCHC-type containing protein [Tanacetum coccineum]
MKVDRTIEKFKERLVIQGFRQKSGIDYFDTYAPLSRISTIRLLIAMASIHNLIIYQMDVNKTLLNGELEYEVDMTKEFLSSRFSMKDMGEDDVILGIRIKHESNGIAISQSYYIEKLLKKFNYFDCTPGDWLPNISNTEDNSSTCSWVFLLGGGAISWASKKQTCITGLTMEYEFVALAAAGKEAGWLRNLILEIPLWSKPIAPISILCNSVATLAKAYSQMYNRKSRHLGVRHRMIRELIMNGVVSIDFVRSQQNLSDHLTKGLARDLVLNELKHMYLHIIPRMCLEHAEKKDEVFTSQWLISLKKCLAVGKGIRVTDEVTVVFLSQLNGIHQSDGFSFLVSEKTCDIRVAEVLKHVLELSWYLHKCWSSMSMQLWICESAGTSGLESNEPYDEGGDCADIGNDSAPTKSTHKPRVNIVDSSARNKDNIQFEIEVSVSNLKSVDVTGSTSSRKDTRKENTSLHDDEYESEGEDSLLRASDRRSDLASSSDSSTSLPHSVPREDPPQLTPFLDILISSSP